MGLQGLLVGKALNFSDSSPLHCPVQKETSPVKLSQVLGRDGQLLQGERMGWGRRHGLWRETDLRPSPIPDTSTWEVRRVIYLSSKPQLLYLYNSSLTGLFHTMDVTYTIIIIGISLRCLRIKHHSACSSSMAPDT